MKKTISVLLAMLLIALTLTPALAAGGTYQVTFTAPSAEVGADAYTFVKSVNGEFTEFEEDPDGGYGYYSEDGKYYYIDNLTTKSREVFDNAAPGSPESIRYSPAKWTSGPVDANTTVSFRVVTSEKYDATTVVVMCNGEIVERNKSGEYAVVADQDLRFNVLERDENGVPILLTNHFTVALTSGDGYAVKPKLGTNNRAAYYGEDFEFRVKITKGFNGDNMKVKVVRGVDFLSEFLGEDADALSGIMGGETLASTGVDSEGCRTYKIKNVTSECKVLVSGVNKDSSSGILAMLKRILRLLLGLLGINLDSLLGEENNPLAAYTVSLDPNISTNAVTYKTNPEFKYNAETGKYEAEVLSGEGITIAVTKTRENQDVIVKWTPGNETGLDYDVNWQSYYDFSTQQTTWSAVYYVDGITANTAISIIAN